MSNLSELLPAGAGAKSADFVASGTLGSGVTVALKADGTVSAVSSTGLTYGFTGSATTVFETTTGNSEPRLAYDPATNQVVIFYVDGDNSSYTTAVVGSVNSDNTFTFGSPTVVQSTSNTGFAWGSPVWNSTENAAVFAWQTSSGFNLVACTLGTLTASFGTIVTYTSGTPNNIGLGWNQNDNVILVPYRINNANLYIRKYTISGTTLTYSAQSNTNLNMNAEQPVVGYDSSSQKCVLAYTDNTQASWLSANVIDTSSGLTVGSKLSISDTLGLGTGAPGFIASDTDQDILAIAWVTPASTNGRAKAAVLTVSGTTLSVGSATEINSSNNWTFQSGGYSPAASAFVWTGTNRSSPKQLFTQTFTVSGTTVTKTSDGGNSPFNNVSAYHNTVLNTSNNAQFFVVWANDSTTRDVFVQVLNTSSSITNSADFIGITDQAIADTATGAVIVQGGVSEKLSGLTVGADYYVQADGSLAFGSIPFSISGATYTQNFSVSSQDSSPRGIAFNTDGTKMFITGSAGVDINEYALTTGFDISTASYSQNFSVISETTSPRGVAFNTDGTKMFVVGQVGSTIYEYNLSTGFNISTASYSQNFSLSSQETGAQDVAFNSDGTKMFVVGTTGQDVNEYTLSTGFDVSTASYSQNFSVSSQDTIPTGITFNTDGTSMFITGQTNDKVFEYTLTSGFDVSTASYSSTSFSVLSEESNPLGLVFNANGTKMFITGTSGDDVNEYSTTAASTTVPAGRALSSTSILLEG